MGEPPAEGPTQLPEPGRENGSESTHSEGPPASSRPPWVRLAVLLYGALLAIALVWMGLSEPPMFFASEAAGLRGVAPLRDVLAGALAAGIVILGSHQMTERTSWGRELAEALGEALGPLTWSECAILALTSGVAEEALFRGALQPSVGLVAASLIFGLVHFVPRRELLPWTLFAIVVGFLLGVLFETTGNLIAPIVAHVLINLVNLRLLSTR